MRAFLNFLKAGRVTVEKKWPDMWIGVFWRTATCPYCEQARHLSDVWICFIPCVPIHVRWPYPYNCPEIPF